MSAWLYQMNQQDWKPERYRSVIWESERWAWGVGRKVGGAPKPGDILVFFYAKSGGDDAGFYGWAIVTEWAETEDRLYFRPTAPSDHLKMFPWSNSKAMKLADKIRGAVKQGTLWRIEEEQWKLLRAGITSWIAGRA